MCTCVRQGSLRLSKQCCASLKIGHLHYVLSPYAQIGQEFLENLIAVPYPTSVTSTIQWTRSQKVYDKKNDKTLEYIASRQRPMAVLFEGKFENDHGPRPVRQFLKSVFLARSRRGSLVGRIKESEQRQIIYNPGNDMWLPNFWDNAINSQFCLEPPGDTPTRSHLFVAILSGCIPVIFDHEQGGGGWFGNETSRYFDGATDTVWPWRNNPHPIGLEYSDFAVIFDFRDLKSNKVDFLDVLLSMPTEDPQRFQELRMGLDRAAKWFHYQLKECDTPLCDGFAMLQITLEMLEPKLRHNAEIHYNSSGAGQIPTNQGKLENLGKERLHQHLESLNAEETELALKKLREVRRTRLSLSQSKRRPQ